MFFKLLKKSYLFLFAIFILSAFCGAALSAQETVEPERMYEIEGHKTVLEIFANQPDVNVFLNGTYQGRTNLTIYDLTPGFYQLRLEKEGCEGQEHTIFVKAHYGQYYWFEIK
ncbi:PEGA domain-containing protein [Treponema sp. C6A8]|uniref:PEGA domain-containing protein n=1 Tax=Treponema sp. C6A8 TaxID=1410609 RepID=UPI00047F604B|nr:PEGA domain-containing protein [Treponema sp. C6A8]